jgi:hypothetical protein
MPAKKKPLEAESSSWPQVAAGYTVPMRMLPALKSGYAEDGIFSALIEHLAPTKKELEECVIFSVPGPVSWPPVGCERIKLRFETDPDGNKRPVYFVGMSS